MIITTPYQPEPQRFPGGPEIRGRRVRAGLTLRRCAELLGLSLTDLSAVERGQRQFTEREAACFERVAGQGGGGC